MKIIFLKNFKVRIKPIHVAIFVKKKTNKKNFFCLTLSKKVYVFNHQQLMHEIFF